MLHLGGYSAGALGRSGAGGETGSKGGPVTHLLLSGGQVGVGGLAQERPLADGLVREVHIHLADVRGCARGIPPISGTAGSPGTVHAEPRCSVAVAANWGVMTARCAPLLMPGAATEARRSDAAMLGQLVNWKSRAVLLIRFCML